MQAFDFSEPIRQSSKGILVIFGFNLYKFLKRFFVILLAFGISLTKENSFFNLSPTLIILISIGILLVILIVAILMYLNFKFYVTNDDFHLTRGIVNKEKTVIPKSKIQNVYIKQNLLQQLINVVSVNIETAGDDKSEIEISALDKSMALALKKDLFIKHSNSVTNEIIDDTKSVFYKASPMRLLLEGISQNHFRSFLIIMSFFFGIYHEFKEYLQEFKIMERIEGSVDLEGDDIFNLIVANAIVIILVVLFSSLFSVIKTFIVNFDLQVIEHQKRIEINKGLFNKVSLSLTPSRIQNLVIKTNRLKRYLGLYTVAVKQAMVNSKQRKSFVIVALEKAQVSELIHKLIANYNSALTKHKPEFYYNRISAIEMFIMVLVFNIPAYFVFGYNKWWINCILFPIAVGYIYLSYKKSYYQIDDEFVTVGSGVIDTTTTILEIHKIQSIELKQSIFQKRRHITSLIISTASQDVKIPYVKEEVANDIFNFLIYRVETQQKNWM